MIKRLSSGEYKFNWEISTPFLAQQHAENKNNLVQNIPFTHNYLPISTSIGGLLKLWKPELINYKNYKYFTLLIFDFPMFIYAVVSENATSSYFFNLLFSNHSIEPVLNPYRATKDTLKQASPGRVSRISCFQLKTARRIWVIEKRAMK